MRKLTAPSTLLYHVFDTQPTPTQPSEPKLLLVSFVPVLVCFLMEQRNRISQISGVISSGSAQVLVRHSRVLFLHKCNPDDPVLCPLSPTDADQFR